MNANRILGGFLIGVLGAAWACSSEAERPDDAAGASGAADEPGDDSRAAADGGATAGGGGADATFAGGAESEPRDSAQAGAGGEAPAPRSCKTDEDCDDGKVCSGREACVRGSCQAGKAVACADNLSCSDEDDGACVYADPSPWVVYQADDDTPGVQEIYAIKRDLAGKMQPIKLNEPLEAGWQSYGVDTWTPDPQLYLFTARGGSPEDAKIELVYFDAQGPQPPLVIDGANPLWSPSGRYLFVTLPHGVSIYEHEGAGKLTRVFEQSDPGFAALQGRWSENDKLFFSATGRDGVSTLYAVADEKSKWTAQSLVTQAKAILDFVPDPDGGAVAYSLDPRPNGETWWGVEAQPGSDPAVVASNGRTTLSWLPDGSRYLLTRYVETEQVIRGWAWIGEGSSRERKKTPVAVGELVLTGTFSPDGTSILLAEPVEGGGVDVRVLNEQTGKTDRSLGVQDEAFSWPRFAADGDTAVMPTLRGANAELSLVSLSGRVSGTLDAIPSGQRFERYEITPGGEFVAYTKGVAPDLDGAYVDLRHPTGRKPIRMPGDGSVYSFQFDDVGQGLFYIRERDNGARECSYLDLSRQVAQPPVKLSRDGRVDVCVPQPSAG